MTGYEAKSANTAAPCPVCKVKIMIPAQSGEESFILGSVPGAAAEAKSGAKKPAAAEHAPHAHKTVKKKTDGDAPFNWPPVLVGVLVLGILAALAIRSTLKAPQSDKPAAAAPLQQPPSDTKVSQSGPAHPATPLDAKKSDADTMEIGPRADARVEQPAISAPPPAISDLLAAKDNKASRIDDGLDPARTPKVEKAPASTEDPELKKQLGFNTPPSENRQPSQPVNSDPKTPVTLPKNTGPAKVAAAPIPAAPGVCPSCGGMGAVPIIPQRPYVHIGVDKLDASSGESVPWRYCPKCQADKDAKALIEAEKNRMAAAVATHQHWEQLTHAKLTYAETRHITIRSTMPESDVRAVAQAIEQLTGQLETITLSTALTQTRPDTDELLIAWDQIGYAAMINALAQQDPNQNWAMVQAASGVLLPHKAVMNANHGIGFSVKNMALYRFGELAIMQATDNKAPTWLHYGFASYCENLSLKKNMVYSFNYDKTEQRLSDNWDLEIKKYGAQGKFKPWAQVFNMQPIGMSAADYLTSYSIVCFMMSTDSKLFPKFVLAIKEGLDTKTAMERTYGMEMAKIQEMWGKWTVGH